jgi:hypothetical protein
MTFLASLSAKAFSIYSLAGIRMTFWAALSAKAILIPSLAGIVMTFWAAILIFSDPLSIALTFTVSFCHWAIRALTLPVSSGVSVLLKLEAVPSAAPCV